MILYFSATGNTRFVAGALAAQLGDEAIDLLDRIRRGDHAPIRSDRPFVICTPVYVCEMPRFLAEYLREVRPALPAECDPHGGRQARMAGQDLHPLHVLHTELPRGGHRVRAGHAGEGALPL